jgi:hypothetical protein
MVFVNPYPTRAIPTETMNRVYISISSSATGRRDRIGSPARLAARPSNSPACHSRSLEAARCAAEEHAAQSHGQPLRVRR